MMNYSLEGLLQLTRSDDGAVIERGDELSDFNNIVYNAKDIVPCYRVHSISEAPYIEKKCGKEFAVLIEDEIVECRRVPRKSPFGNGEEFLFSMRDKYTRTPVYHSYSQLQFSNDIGMDGRKTYLEYPLIYVESGNLTLIGGENSYQEDNRMETAIVQG